MVVNWTHGRTSGERQLVLQRACILRELTGFQLAVLARDVNVVYIQGL